MNGKLLRNSAIKQVVYKTVQRFSIVTSDWIQPETVARVKLANSGKRRVKVEYLPRKRASGAAGADGADGACG